MNPYFIESFKITKLWGYHNINLNFSNDVNILIGPNGSGKTTILHLLHSILSADLRGALDVNFDQAVIKLRSFTGRSERTVKIDATSRKLSVGQKKFDIDMITIPDLFSGSYMSLEKSNMISGSAIRGAFREKIIPREFYDELIALVPIVWLPVSRRLPVTKSEEEQHTRTDPLESVDVRLRELLDGLSRYHSGLNALLSERYKEFEHQVLSAILYSKEHDQPNLIPASSPTKAEKEQLLGAFEAAGLLNEAMETRIDEHFTAAEEVLKRIGKNPAILDDEDVLVLSLIGRTKAMVGYAEELEKDREQIFAPLRRYEETVNSFLNDEETINSFLDEKSVKVGENGELKIESPSHPNIDPFVLSSGEKQILILLTQALLKVDEPVVYIADEPELSLHVLWQEKLLESLVKLGGQIQVIVATHSPDIVGKFMDKIIDLGRKN